MDAAAAHQEETKPAKAVCLTAALAIWDRCGKWLTDEFKCYVKGRLIWKKAVLQKTI